MSADSALYRPPKAQTGGRHRHRHSMLAVAVAGAAANATRDASREEEDDESLVPHSAPTHSASHIPQSSHSSNTNRLHAAHAVAPRRPMSPTLQRVVAPSTSSHASRAHSRHFGKSSNGQTPSASPPWRGVGHLESSPPDSSKKPSRLLLEQSISRPYSSSGSLSRNRKRSYESLRAFRLRSSYDQFLGRTGPNTDVLGYGSTSPSRSSYESPIRNAFAFSAPNAHTGSHAHHGHAHTHGHSAAKGDHPQASSRITEQQHPPSSASPRSPRHHRTHYTHAHALPDDSQNTNVGSISPATSSLHSSHSFIASLPRSFQRTNTTDGSLPTSSSRSQRTGKAYAHSASAHGYTPPNLGGTSPVRGRYKRYMSALSGRSSLMSSFGRTPSSVFSDDSTVLNGGTSTYGDTTQRYSKNLSPRHIKMLTILFIAIFIMSIFLFLVPLIIFATHFEVFSAQSLRVLMPWVRPLVFLYWAVFVFVVVAVSIVGVVRRNYHTIRSRSPFFLLIVTVATFLFTTWLCVAMWKRDQNFMGCVASLWLFTILYPMLTFPYFFRALRISRVFDAGDTKKKKIGKSSAIQALSEPLTGGRAAMMNNSSLAVQPSGTMGTGNGVGEGGGYATNGSPDEMSEADKMAARSASESHLLKWFAIVMLPFVIMAIVQSVGSKAPMFSVLNAECLSPSDPFAPKAPDGSGDASVVEGGNARSDAVVDYFTVYSILEGGFMLASIVVLSNIRKEYNIQAMRYEFVVSFLVYAVFLAVIIVFFLFTTRRFETELLVLSRSIALFVVSVEWPLFRTFFHTPLPFDFPYREAISSLGHVLKDPMSCVFFQQFMIEEDQDRLLKFWMEVGFFQEQASEDPACTTSEATRLLDTYLSEDADTRKRALSTPSQAHSINSITERSPTYSHGIKASPPSSTGMMDNTPLLKNISKSDDVLEDMAPRISHDSLESAISNGWFHADIEEGAILRSQSLSLFLTQDDRKALWITLEENPSATMFDDAQKKCFEYMEKQCYPRFLRSSLCKEYLAEVDRKEAVVGRLIESRFW